jgi:group I intron endonuclease
MKKLITTFINQIFPYIEDIYFIENIQLIKENKLYVIDENFQMIDVKETTTGIVDNNLQKHFIQIESYKFLKPIGYVYETVNLVNQMKYIGATTKFTNSYIGSGIEIKKAIKEYGKNNFIKQILSFAYSLSELSELEVYFIRKVNADTNPSYYNVLPRGNYSFREDTSVEKNNYRILENIKEKSLLSKEQNKDKSNPNYGNYWTEEQKLALSKKRKANGKSVGKNNTNYGKKDELATNGKKVYMYDRNYNLEKVFNTITLALKYLNLKGHKQLYHAIMNETWYKGHYWRKEFNKI